MKKLISLILSLGLVLSVSITAFAAEDDTQAVTGTYCPTESGTVYAIDIAWGSMEFTYKVPADIWDAEEHKYSSGGTGKWTCEDGANVVTVTNRSNAAMDVTVTTDTGDTGDSGITAAITNSSFTLGNAAEGATTEVAGTATSGSASITLSGELTNTAAEKTTIGTVTVTIKESGKNEDLILDHTAGTEIVYKWSEDYKTCTACYNCICVIGGTCNYLHEQETVAAVVTEAENGYLHTATFTDTTLGVAEKLVGYQYDKTTNTYSVWNEAGLNIWRLAVAEKPSTNLTLTDDIILSTEGITVDENGKPSGSNWTYVPQFEGTLDGGGHSIVNLRMYEKVRSYFFGIVIGGTIKNLTFVNPVIYGELTYTATLTCQIAKGGSIINCHVQGGSVTGEMNGTGGLIGTTSGSAYVYGCTNSAKVTGTSSVGGIIGITSTINDNVFAACANTGKVVSEDSKVGGICGNPQTLTNLIACYTTEGNLCGNTNATVTGSYYVASEDTDGEDGTTAVADTAALNSNDVVTAMNAAIDTYNSSATKKLAYKWAVGTDGLPVLVEAE